MPTLLFSHLPIPHRIAGFALTATFFILVLLGLAHHRNLRGEILDSPSLPASASSSLRYSRSSFVSEQDEEPMPAVAIADPALADDKKDSYYIFLQKFPLESSWKMLFHTEVIVCPRETFSKDAAFLNMLDGLSNTLSPSRFDQASSSVGATQTAPFAPIEKDRWSKQSEPGCVQLGYGGANCGSSCCGSPHKQQNRNYALNSQQAVIGNAMGELKELYFYGVSSGSTDASAVTEGGNNGISGEEAYKAVCHGHMNAIEMGKVPMCVSNWTGRDYNPLTNNCNTYTSTVLKCVYGLSDAKPHLGVSDMRTVTCPSEMSGKQLDQCAIPSMVESARAGDLSLE